MNSLKSTYGTLLYCIVTQQYPDVEQDNDVDAMVMVDSAVWTFHWCERITDEEMKLVELPVSINAWRDTPLTFKLVTVRDKHDGAAAVNKEEIIGVEV